jgi:hypothetical protein
MSHAVVLELVPIFEGDGHKILMENYFSSLKLFIDFAPKDFSTCHIVHHNRKEMPPNFSTEHVWLGNQDSSRYSDWLWAG